MLILCCQLQNESIHMYIVYIYQLYVVYIEFRTSTFSYAFISATVYDPNLLVRSHEYFVASDRVPIVKGPLGVNMYYIKGTDS